MSFNVFEKYNQNQYRRATAGVGPVNNFLALAGALTGALMFGSIAKLAKLQKAASFVTVLSGAISKLAQTKLAGALLATGSTLRGRFMSAAMTPTAAIINQPQANKAGKIAASRSPYFSAVITDGATHYWRLNESSGSTLTDCVRGGVGARNFTLFSTVGVTYNLPGALADGDTGINSGGVRATCSSFASGTTFTMEAWIRPTSAVASGTILGDNDGIFGFVGWLYNGGTGKMSWRRSSSITDTTVLSAGTIYHVAVSVDAGTATFYVNGVAGLTSAGALSNAIKYTFATDAGSILSADFVDELAYYPVALSQQQLQNHYDLRTAHLGTTKQPQTVLAGVASLAAAIVKQAQLQKIASLTPSAVVIASRVVLRAINRTLTLMTGAVIKQAQKPLGASQSTAAAVMKLGQLLKGATLTPVAAIVNLTKKALAAGLTPTAAVIVSRVILRAINRTLTLMTGAVVKQPQKLLAGSQSTTAAIKKLGQTALRGTLLSSAALIKSVTKKLTGALLPTGAITTTRVLLKALNRVFTPHGAIVKQPQKALSGTATFTSKLTNAVTRFLTGAQATTSTLRRDVTKKTVATLPPVGTITKQPQLPKAGGLTATATVRRLAQKLVSGTPTLTSTLRRDISSGLRGFLSPFGALRKKTTIQALTGSLTPSGDSVAVWSTQTIRALLLRLFITHKSYVDLPISVGDTIALPIAKTNVYLPISTNYK